MPQQIIGWDRYARLAARPHVIASNKWCPAALACSRTSINQKAIPQLGLDGRLSDGGQPNESWGADEGNDDDDYDDDDDDDGGGDGGGGSVLGWDRKKGLDRCGERIVRREKYKGWGYGSNSNDDDDADYNDDNDNDNDDDNNNTKQR